MTKTRRIYVGGVQATPHLAKIGTSREPIEDRYASENDGAPVELRMNRYLDLELPYDTARVIEAHFKTRCLEGDGEYIRQSPQSLREDVGGHIAEHYPQHYAAYLQAVAVAIDNPYPKSTKFRDYVKARKQARIDAGVCIDCGVEPPAIKSNGKPGQKCKGCAAKTAHTARIKRQAKLRVAS